MGIKLEEPNSIFTEAAVPLLDCVDQLRYGRGTEEAEKAEKAIKKAIRHLDNAFSNLR